MYDPIATYRLQFHKDFNFDNFEQVIPYLHKLGVKTIYASPIFKAVPGSIHGYDVTDPNMINPEIGTLEQLYRISGMLKELGMGWIQDIVPNHMAFHADNKWLTDVWEKGKESAYARYFDIDWEHPHFAGRLAIPILGKSLDEVIADGDITLRRKSERIFLDCQGSHLPLSVSSRQLTGDLAVGSTDTAINIEPKRLKELLNHQNYTLCHWQDTNKRLNYRRFFTINGLISINIQDEKVFNDYHTLVRQLCHDGVFQGLRVDHIDGLCNPAQYLYRLRRLAGDKAYISIEKILGAREELPTTWGIQGTTGYDFLAMVNNVLSDKTQTSKLTALYNTIAGNDWSYQQVLLNKKKLILDNYFAADLDNLERKFLDAAAGHTAISIHDINTKAAIRAFLVHFPVYRFYGNRLPLDEDEAMAIKGILDRIVIENPKIVGAAQLLEQILLGKPNENDLDHKVKALLFYQRCMQYTGPLMAKGGEDTAMYTYNSFIGHNEVGDDPGNIGYTIAEFHELMQDRQNKWRCTMNGTATHDTKRGEDTRARLNVLSELIGEWTSIVKQWQQSNSRFKTEQWPDNNDEYLIYQALIGVMPMPGIEDEGLTKRFHDYLQKALREAKTHTDWAKPDDEYEEAAKQFVEGIFYPGSGFGEGIKRFVREIADYGIINSLVQLVLKFTCPGIPDIYQGCELWDLSMVDPDNRRPVNYELRNKLLSEISSTKAADMQTLWNERYSGKIKLWLTYKLLMNRAQMPEVFSKGSYEPLVVTGNYAEHIIAFAHKHQKDTCVVILPVRIATIAKQQQKEVTNIDWADTAISLTDDLNGKWRNLLDDSEINSGKVNLAQLFKQIPLAILNKR